MEEVVRWERYLPRMVVRVLVVEPDDSTRSVISALLRNCHYQVTCVADGLEAWEELKEKPHSIDLVLTEVDLPSISGFTLLTLLMDHPHLRERIPVIMMSSKDSIGTVLKCMLKGAADFLIKPVRKNELKNIWQHFWRRHLTTAENKHLSTGEESREHGARSFSNAEQEEFECKDLKIISKVERDDALDERKASNRFDVEHLTMYEDSRQHRVIGVRTAAELGSETRCTGFRNSDAVTVIDNGAIVKRAKVHDSIELPEACDLQLGLSLQGSVPSASRTNEADGGCLLHHSSASAFSRYRSGNRVERSKTSNVESCRTFAWSAPITGNTDKSASYSRPSELHKSDKHEMKIDSMMEDCLKPGRLRKELNENTSDILIRGGPNGVDTFHRSAREAALIKFRQKRMERCFEKKVRYHSRKQIAEQRPRVKGQFVRQMQADLASSAGY